MLPLQVSVDGILHVSCSRPEQECILLQPDIGVDDKENKVLQNKPLLVRSSRDHRKSDSSKGCQHELPSKTSSLIPEV